MPKIGPIHFSFGDPVAKSIEAKRKAKLTKREYVKPTLGRVMREEAKSSMNSALKSNFGSLGGYVGNKIFGDKKVKFSSGSKVSLGGLRAKSLDVGIKEHSKITTNLMDNIATSASQGFMTLDQSISNAGDNSIGKSLNKLEEALKWQAAGSAAVSSPIQQREESDPYAKKTGGAGSSWNWSDVPWWLGLGKKALNFVKGAATGLGRFATGTVLGGVATMATAGAALGIGTTSREEGIIDTKYKRDLKAYGKEIADKRRALAIKRMNQSRTAESYVNPWAPDQYVDKGAPDAVKGTESKNDSKTTDINKLTYDFMHEIKFEAGDKIVFKYKSGHGSLLNSDGTKTTPKPNTRVTGPGDTNAQTRYNENVARYGKDKADQLRDIQDNRATDPLNWASKLNPMNWFGGSNNDTGNALKSTGSDISGSQEHIGGNNQGGQAPATNPQTQTNTTPAAKGGGVVDNKPQKTTLSNEASGAPVKVIYDQEKGFKNTGRVELHDPKTGELIGTYPMVSGGAGKGSTPTGEMQVDPGMMKGGVLGDRFRVSQKGAGDDRVFDPSINDTRSEIRFHKSLGEGTHGCIGIYGDDKVYQDFKTKMLYIQQQTGGVVKVRVGTPEAQEIMSKMDPAPTNTPPLTEGKLEGARVYNSDNPTLNIGKGLQDMGLRVSENENFGGVQSGVHAGHGHDDGRAIDVNVGHGLTEANHPQWGPIYDKLSDYAKGQGYNTIWRASGHYNHMHIEAPKGMKGNAIDMQEFYKTLTPEQRSFIEKDRGVKLDDNGKSEVGLSDPNQLNEVDKTSEPVSKQSLNSSPVLGGEKTPDVAHIVKPDIKSDVDPILKQTEKKTDAEQLMSPKNYVPVVAPSQPSVGFRKYEGNNKPGSKERNSDDSDSNENTGRRSFSSYTNNDYGSAG